MPFGIGWQWNIVEMTIKSHSKKNSYIHKCVETIQEMPKLKILVKI